MNALLTGASGFLGRYIHAELSPQHTVTTLGRTLAGPLHIACDLTRAVPMLPDRRFDFVIHAAGKANAIPRNASDRADYERINVQGTVRLLSALNRLTEPPGAFVFISSVLVYGRTEGQLLDERIPLHAGDPYGSSKARAERLVQRWGEQTGVRVAILRLPLVAADPPVGNLAALARAIRRGYYVRLGKGQSRRSMVRVDDVARIIPKAAEQGGTYHLTDGYHPTVRELENAFARRVNRARLPGLPLRVARSVARVGDGVNRLAGRNFPLDSTALRKLTSTLTFSDELARQQLGWNPRPVLDLFR